MYYPSSGRWSSDIMITQKQKNTGELINIFFGQLLTEMAVPVIPDILKILNGFGCVFNIFHRQILCQL